MDEHTVYSCPMCHAEELSIELLQKHITLVHPDCPAEGCSSSSLHECPLCGEVFDTVCSLELHVNTSHLEDSIPQTSLENLGFLDSCPVCNRKGFRTNMQLDSHLKEHFPSNGENGIRMHTMPTVNGIKHEHGKEYQKMKEEQEFLQLRKENGMALNGTYLQQAESNMQRAVFNGQMTANDYYEKQIQLKLAERIGFDDGSSCTKGLITTVSEISNCSHGVRKSHLCSYVDHYAGSHGDKGWGCGYRNLQMMLSCLLKNASYQHISTEMPSITRIQELIDRAWMDGFDAQGRSQFPGGKIMHTKSWIGPTEIATFFSAFRIRCQLIDFHKPTGPTGGHPQLFNWLLTYFSSGKEVKPPVYIQHQGHSRTVIGVEEQTSGALRLLILDPSQHPDRMASLLFPEKAAATMGLLRKGLQHMQAQQYQLAVVDGFMDSDEEYQKCKVLTSKRIP